jgi:hypothetical protein
MKWKKPFTYLLKKLKKFTSVIRRTIIFSLCNPFGRLMSIYFSLSIYSGRFYKNFSEENQTFVYWICDYSMQVYLYSGLLWVFLQRDKIKVMNVQDEKMFRSFLWALIGLAIFQVFNQYLKNYTQNKWDILQFLLPFTAFAASYNYQLEKPKP